jgi:hypothetical protein
LAARIGRIGVKSRTCQPQGNAVLSDLPIKRLTQATRKGQSKLAAEQGNFAGQIHPYKAVRGESSHRKGITPRGKRNPHPDSIPKHGPMSFKTGEKWVNGAGSKAPEQSDGAPSPSGHHVRLNAKHCASLLDVLNNRLDRQPLRSLSKPGQAAGK